MAIWTRWIQLWIYASVYITPLAWAHDHEAHGKSLYPGDGSYGTWCVLPTRTALFIMCQIFSTPPENRVWHRSVHHSLSQPNVFVSKLHILKHVLTFCRSFEYKKTRYPACWVGWAVGGISPASLVRRGAPCSTLSSLKHIQFTYINIFTCLDSGQTWTNSSRPWHSGWGKSFLQKEW